MIVVVVVWVWLAWCVYKVERQKKAVAWIRENGGTVTYDYELNSLGGYDPESQPPGPEWLQNIFGVDYYSTVVSVSLEGENFSDLTPLVKGLPYLKELGIFATQVHV